MCYYVALDGVFEGVDRAYSFVETKFYDGQVEVCLQPLDEGFW